jgi:4-alpha-glucanotransferase
MSVSGFYHNSHDLFYRSPFGAVPCGAGITLGLKAPPGGPSRRVFLIWREDAGQAREVPMVLSPEAGGRALYRAEIPAPPEAGLLWYHFRVEEREGTVFCGSPREGLGGPSVTAAVPPAPYQVTVYRPAATPSWFKDAVVYQIFPDRFCNGLPRGRVLNPKKNSLLHARWDNIPYYIRDPATGDVARWDFFGGNLPGILKKLPYLKKLGIKALYLNPIFAAQSNHRYDTADYYRVDPMLGSNRLFSLLCRRAGELGIAVILDGVFSHTGSDSLYFNKEGNYPGPGAYESTDSPYYKWYRFENHPEEYEAWWGIKTLPNVNEMEPSYLDFVLNGENSVIKHWARLGAAGWRLDVADELPAPFIRHFRTALKALREDYLLLGEVWEDASNKISYGERRSYLLGEELDSVMNYPFRDILLNFLLGRQDGREVNQALVSLQENYPPEHFYAALNLLGSHDKPRILTALAEGLPPEMPEQEKLAIARDRLKLAVFWQMTFPGPPSIYYGDEAGLAGGEDPDNRRGFPWGREDGELLAFFREMTAVRNHYDVLRTGEWFLLQARGDLYCYGRKICGGRDPFGQEKKDNSAVILLNRSLKDSRSVELDVGNWFSGRSAVSVGEDYREIPLQEGRLSMELRPLEGKLLLQDRFGHNLSHRREAGILLHPTSLPGPGGTGSLGKEACAFVDFLAGSGQTLWQILPLNPPGYGDSPYQCYSAFAGNPLLIDLELLVEQGLLPAAVPAEAPAFPEGAADFRAAWDYKEKRLRQAFEAFGAQESGDYREFLTRNSGWLEDYALFMALKGRFGGRAWIHWEPAAARREEQALKAYRQELSRDIGFHCFLQYLFFRQWQNLKTYANQRGVRIIGDLPIFVAHDSSDVWVNSRLFELDEAGNPTKVAGVPPDYFSETGQLWGNPHYRWQEMARDDYQWWRDRFATLADLVDVIRIDHFRGFEAYWEIPGGDRTAERGRWVKGPGERFFRVIKKYLGELPIIAEDLGVITPAVEDLKEALGYPGMKIMQFALEEKPEEEFRLPLADMNAVVYTGTHDNDTMLGWYREKYRGFKDLKNLKDEEICWYFIERAYRSNAVRVIIPLQDVLALDSSARMNIPGTSEGNWRWRFPAGSLGEALAARLQGLAQTYDRG